MMRVGSGYDAHPLVEGQALVLGGVNVPFERGLTGHSDADVVCHAVTDALLGAAAMGDIGKHFPPSDPKFKNANSLEFLIKTAELLSKSGWRISNVDATIVAQRPKLSPFVNAMRENVSKSLGIGVEQVSVKCKTTNGLGFEGREEGISAYAVALIESVK